MFVGSTRLNLYNRLPQLENPKDEKELKKYLPWSTNIPDEIKEEECTEVVTEI